MGDSREQCRAQSVCLGLQLDTTNLISQSDALQRERQLTTDFLQYCRLLPDETFRTRFR